MGSMIEVRIDKGPSGTPTFASELSSLRVYGVEYILNQVEPRINNLVTSIRLQKESATRYRWEVLIPQSESNNSSLVFYVVLMRRGS